MTSTQRRPSSSTAGRSDRDAGEPACDPHRAAPNHRPMARRRARDLPRPRRGRPMPATEPEQLHGLFEQAFNAGDVEALMALYEPDAALIPQPGALAEGTAAIRDSLRWFLDRRGRITLGTKLVLRVGALAFLSERRRLARGGVARRGPPRPPGPPPPP